MRELIRNFQPTILVLFALVVFLIRSQKLQKEKVRSPHEIPHWPLRITLWLATMLVFSFAVSFFLAPADYIWANTACIFALIVLYVVKVYTDIEKVRRNLK